jgi:hypothetical protein
MIEKQLIFDYNLDYNYLYNITVNDNRNIINIIEEIIDYKQGVWNDNKRKDILKLKFDDIPLNITSNIITIKFKIKLLEQTPDNYKLQLKIKNTNKIINVISKIINIKMFCNIIKTNENQTRVVINYTIKSILPDDLIIIVNNYLENKLKNNFIKKIDNYLKDLSNNNNHGGIVENS